MLNDDDDENTHCSDENNEMNNIIMTNKILYYVWFLFTNDQIK